MNQGKLVFSQLMAFLPLSTVNANWRMTFEFKDGNAYVLDYEDYH